MLFSDELCHSLDSNRSEEEDFLAAIRVLAYVHIIIGQCYNNCEWRTNERKRRKKSLCKSDVDMRSQIVTNNRPAYCNWGPNSSIATESLRIDEALNWCSSCSRSAVQQKINRTGIIPFVISNGTVAEHSAHYEMLPFFFYSKCRKFLLNLIGFTCFVTAYSKCTAKSSSLAFLINAARNEQHWMPFSS